MGNNSLSYHKFAKADKYLCGAGISKQIAFAINANKFFYLRISIFWTEFLHINLAQNPVYMTSRDAKISFKSFQLFICLSIPIIVLNGCAQRYYVADQHHLYLFKAKGDIRLAGSCGEGDENTDIYAGNFAYSFTEKFAVSFDISQAYGNGNSGSSGGFLIGSSIGLYKNFRDKLYFDVFAGAGYAHQRHNIKGTYYPGGYQYNAPEVSYFRRGTVDFFKVQINPSIGYRNKWFDIGLSTKITHLDFFNKNFDAGLLPDGSYPGAISRGLDLNYGTFFEPGLVARIGYKNIKIQGQYAFCLQVFGSSANASETMKSLGIQLNFTDKMFQRKKKNPSR